MIGFPLPRLIIFLSVVSKPRNHGQSIYQSSRIVLQTHLIDKNKTKTFDFSNLYLQIHHRRARRPKPYKLHNPLPNHILRLSKHLFGLRPLDNKPLMHKTQPKSVLRPMSSRLINHKKQCAIRFALLPNQPPVTDILANSARGIGDLI